MKIFVTLILLSASACFAVVPDQTINIKNNSSLSLDLNLSIPEYTAATIAIKKLQDAQEMLNKAILTNSVQGVKEAVLAGADVNFNNNGSTPLLLAVAFKRLDIVNALLGYGAVACETLVQKAINLDDFKTAVLLTKKGRLNINTLYRGPSGQATLLGHALERHKAEDALALVQSGADFSQCFGPSNKYAREEGIVMLYAIQTEEIARNNASLQLIQELINNGYNIHDNKWNSSTWRRTLHCKRALELFLKNGAHPNQIIDISKPFGVNGAYATPLLVAIFYGWKESIECLLKAGADINQKACATFFNDSLRDLYTPLEFAILIGKKEIAELLAVYGATL